MTSADPQGANGAAPSPSPADSAAGGPVADLEALRLETRPSPTLPLILAASLSGLTLAVGAALALVPVDQVLTISGKLVTRRSTQTITSPEAGVVQRVLVQEGQLVQAGQPLLELDPRQERSAVRELQTQIAAGEGDEANERLRLQERIASLRRRLELDLRILQPLEQLASQGGTSAVQVNEQARVVETTRSELAESERALQGLRFRAEENRAQLRRDLQASRGRLERITLRAPATGTVLDLRAQNGLVAGPDVPLLRLVPRGTLQAEAQVSNRDLAFIRPGQAAMLSFIAYDPSAYGQLRASVLQVGSDALPATDPGAPPHFPVSLSLAAQSLERQGKRFELQPGMALEAHLQLRRSTLLQLFFSKLHRSLDAVRNLR
jgi:multidrug resistance efflux pump